MDAVADFAGAKRIAFASVVSRSNRGALRTAADTVRRVPRWTVSFADRLRRCHVDVD
jgi:hypothetical protein